MISVCSFPPFPVTKFVYCPWHTALTGSRFSRELAHLLGVYCLFLAHTSQEPNFRISISFAQDPFQGVCFTAPLSSHLPHLHVTGSRFSRVLAHLFGVLCPFSAQPFQKPIFRIAISIAHDPFQGVCCTAPLSNQEPRSHMRGSMISILILAAYLVEPTL